MIAWQACNVICLKRALLMVHHAQLHASVPAAANSGFVKLLHTTVFAASQAQ